MSIRLKLDIDAWVLIVYVHRLMNARDIASNAMITYSNTIVMAVLFLVRLSFKCDRKMNLRNNTMYQWVCKKSI